MLGQAGQLSVASCEPKADVPSQEPVSDFCRVALLQGDIQQGDIEPISVERLYRVGNAFGDDDITGSEIAKLIGDVERNQGIVFNDEDRLPCEWIIQDGPS